jgi:hypothetical protein
LKAKEPALMSFLTGEPHGWWVVSGSADIFWRTSNRPHVGHSYS